VLNTPTLKAIKWWPGALGKTGTHAVLYAQLILGGKEYGVHVFMLQMRDENHLPLPGVNLGDLGVKMGDNANDTGFMSLDNVRVPRTHLLSKYHTVTKLGKYETVLKADPQVHYTTMMSTRAMMVNTAGARLCQASTIAIRYSCVRRQGFKEMKQGISYLSEEYQIVDQKIQQYRLFKQLAHAYGMKFTGTWMLDQLKVIEGGEWGAIKTTEGLKEIAMASAGLKSLCSQLAIHGIEDLRKCCGGNGYLLNSGLAAMACDYLWQITAEGDMIILAMMTARFLHQTVDSAISGNKVSGVVDYFNVLNNKNFSLKSQLPQPARSAADFQNINYVLSLNRFRTLQKNYNVNVAINQMMKDKHCSFQDAFSAYSNETLKATYAHSYYIIMSNFVLKIKECQDERTRTVLTRLCVLMACTNMLDDNWGDILDNDQFKFIRTAINTLLSEIRPDCIALVDAFDIPDFVLKSTLGSYDGNVYEALFEAAQHSTLNRKEVFPGYEEVLRPHLDLELLKKGNVPIPEKAASSAKF